MDAKKSPRNLFYVLSIVAFATFLLAFYALNNLL